MAWHSELSGATAAAVNRGERTIKSEAAAAVTHNAVSK